MADQAFREKLQSEIATDLESIAQYYDNLESYRIQHPGHHVLQYAADIYTRYAMNDDGLVAQDGSGSGRVHIPALAFDWANAVTAKNEQDRAAEFHNYRLLAEKAFLLQSLYPETLNRRQVGDDYYVNMGKTAFQCLIEHPRNRDLSIIYARMADRFVDVADLMRDVHQGNHLHDSADPERMSQQSSATGSKRARSLAEQHGITPFPGPGNNRK